MKIAEQGIEELRQAVDALILIPNDRLLATIDKDTTAKNAFATCDNILKQAVEGISNLITTPGIINIDFADIRAVMENAGAALMGIGHASGEKRAEEAARLAISSPLLEVSINGAKGVLFSIAGGDDLTMFEIQDAARIITESVDPNAKIIFGTVKDEKLKKGEVKVTVIASNFPENSQKRSTPLFQSNNEDKGKIFNGISSFGKTADKSTVDTISMKKVEATPTPAPAPTPAPSKIEDNDDDWSAVPAFLRRSKLK